MSKKNEINWMSFARFTELPMRISSSAYNLSNTAPIKELRELYTHSFDLFRMLQSSNDEASETEFVSEMMNHFNTLKPATILLANPLRPDPFYHVTIHTFLRIFEKSLYLLEMSHNYLGTNTFLLKSALT